MGLDTKFKDRKIGEQNGIIKTLPKARFHATPDDQTERPIESLVPQGRIKEHAAKTDEGLQVVWTAKELSETFSKRNCLESWTDMTV